LLAIQNVCIDMGAKDPASESAVCQKKKSKESTVPQLVTKPVRPSLTQVWQPW